MKGPRANPHINKVGGFFILICLQLFFPGNVFSDSDPFLVIESGMHVGPIFRIGSDENCKLIATASRDKTVRLWNPPIEPGGSPELVHVLRAAIGKGNEGKFRSVAISPDGKLVAAGASGWGLTRGGGPYIYIFSSETGEILKSLALADQPNDLDFSKDGSKLAVALWGGFGFKVWDTKKWNVIGGEEYSPNPGHGFDPHSYGLTFDSKGRLYTVAYDGYLRRYIYNGALDRYIPDSKFKLRGPEKPYALAIHPDDSMVAVTYNAKPSSPQEHQFIEVYLTGDLERGPIYKAIGQKASDVFLAVTWSPDGKRLFGGGKPENEGLEGHNPYPLYFWRDPGFETPEQLANSLNFPRVLRANALQGPANTVIDLVPCGKKQIALGAYDPAFYVLEAEGNRLFGKRANRADMRGKLGADFTVSEDGNRIRFNMTFGGGPDDFVLFDLQAEQLSISPTKPQDLFPAETGELINGLQVTNWNETTSPKLSDQELYLDEHEVSRSLANSPDKDMFVLGAEWSINLYDRHGTRVGRTDVPSVIWGVNIPRKADVIVAASGDGTVRWYRLPDFRELLALYVHPEDLRWIAWTPKGYYMTSVGGGRGEDLLGWHVNSACSHNAKFFEIHAFGEQFNRPDIVKKVLQVYDEEEAIIQAKSKNVERLNDETDIADYLPPIIEILATRYHDYDSQAEIKYKICSPSDLKVTKLEMFIDGNFFDLSNQKTIPQNINEEQTITIPFNKGSTVQMRAMAGHRKGILQSVLIESSIRKPLKPLTLFVLAIGVSKYKILTGLNYADKDARDIAKVLYDLRSSELVEDVQYSLLLDDAANRDGIEKGFRDLVKAIKDFQERPGSSSSNNTVAIIFFSGHGTLLGTPPNQVFYFLPYETRPEFLAVDGLSQDYFNRKLNDITTWKKVLFIDACRNSSPTEGDNKNIIDDYVNLTVYGGLAPYFYTSTTRGDSSIECPKQENGCFTAALLEGLKGRADLMDPLNLINTSELATYLNKQVEKLSREAGKAHIATAGLPHQDAPELFPYIGNYYLIEEGFSCRANAPERPLIKSWKNRLEIKDGKVYEWQTLCNDNPIVHKLDHEVFQILKENEGVIYKNNIFKFYHETPILCTEGGTWCPVER